MMAERFTGEVAYLTDDEAMGLSKHAAALIRDIEDIAHAHTATPQEFQIVSAELTLRIIGLICERTMINYSEMVKQYSKD